MKIAVFNPDGRDADQAFPELAGRLDDSVHAPVNFHAFAACSGGGFYRKAASIPADQKHVLLLLRSDLKACARALDELVKAGKTVAVTWKETGAHQLAQQLDDADILSRFRALCRAAHGALATTPESQIIYSAAGAAKSEYLPTPYPVESSAWDFSVPLAERRGVLIGTREWSVPSRNHLAALVSSAQFGQPVTVFNCDGRAGRKKLEALGHPRLEIVEKRLPYSEYLRTVARHRIVWQLDASCVPGQVAGDAALCRVPCLGGNGAIDREVFPALTGFGRTPGDSLRIAERLLGDAAAYAAQVDADAALAKERVAFTAIHERLAQFFTGLER